MITGLNCQFAVAAADDIEGLIRRLNTLETAVTEAVDEEAEVELGEVSELRESADDAPVVKLVYSILGQAAEEGASDIHSSRVRTTCGCASASTGSSTRPPACRSG